MSAQSIVLFIVMLSVLVVLHEYGHFIIARLNGVRVTDFAMGMGPTLLKWTSPRSGTNYRLNLLPIGGYCQMKGEDGQSNEAEQQRQFRKTAADYEPDNFQAKTPLQRLAIVHGFRTSNRQAFTKFVASKHVNVAPDVLDIIEPPTYETLEALITEISTALHGVTASTGGK